MFQQNILGVDLGINKIGYAIAAIDTIYANPLTVQSLPSKSNLNTTTGLEQVRDKIIELIDSWNIVKIVFGLPVSASTGVVTTKSDEFQQIVLKIVSALMAAEINLEIDYYPEIYSTKVSNQGLSHKQKQKFGDAYAAADILKSYLEFKTGGWY